MNDQHADQELDALLDAALALPPAEQDDFLRSSCPAEFRDRLEHLLALARGTDGFLDRSPMALAAAPAITVPASLSAGERFGAYRLVSRLGAGGMGEVWLAERVEGGFAQQVAIKCLRAESASLLARFDAERAILAGLEHPGIARLYDGGVTADDRPYMIMEYIEGEDLLAWCQRRQASLDERLALFLEVCDAVAHAHTHLVIHRDLKPANILVTPDGRAKLLDFGIAKLLRQDQPADATLTSHLSLAYAAPEQLTGQAITTATDVHALGATLYQMLTGVLPWEVADLPLGLALQRLLTAPPSPPSRVASGSDGVPARLLRGDLDAIVARALRAEPASRYPDARTLAEDIRRHLRHEPVQARSGAGLYVARRFLRRYWLPTAAGAMLFVVLMAGLVGIAWQAQRAAEQAYRALVIKDYLLRIFQASDPRTASERPRGQITARELLDIGTSRIDEEFANRPDLHIELLGLTAGIYRELGETERYEELHGRYMTLARQFHGELHPRFIEGLLLASDDAVLRHDYAEALSRLEAIDPLIRRARLDDSAIRAKWLLRKGNALEAEPQRWAERMAALTEAARLFERAGTDGADYVTTLGNVAAAHWESGEPDARERTRDWLARAISAGEQASRRNDGELQVLYANLGAVQAHLGDAAGADAAFARAVELARMTYGYHDRRYWHAAGSWAGALHGRGERERALSIFDTFIGLLPETPDIEDQDLVGLALTLYGAALVREGRPGEAIAVLETAERGYLRANRGYRLGYLRRVLGEAYEGAGNIDAARRLLESSLQEQIGENAPDSTGVLAARERLGRFLLAHGEAAAAEQELQEVVELSGEAQTLTAALAYGGLARLALARGDADRALQASERAFALLAVAPMPDVRVGAYLSLIRARALLLDGQPDEAQRLGQQALEDYQRYNHPASAEIADARAFVTQLAGDSVEH